MDTYLQTYGVQAWIYFTLKKAGSQDLAGASDWTPAEGDVKVSVNWGNVVNAHNLPEAIGGTGSVVWKLVLWYAEMEAGETVVQIIDQSNPKVIEDHAFLVRTFAASDNHEDAFYNFDFAAWSAPQSGDNYPAMGPLANCINVDLQRVMVLPSLPVLEVTADDPYDPPVPDCTGTYCYYGIIGQRLGWQKPGGSFMLAFDQSESEWRITGSGALWHSQEGNFVGTFNAGEGASGGTVTVSVKTVMDNAYTGQTAETARYMNQFAPAATAVDATYWSNALASSLGGLASKFLGITSVKHWLRGLFRKSTMDATAKAEVNESGGTYDETKHSAEAIGDLRTKLENMIEADGSDYRFKPNAVEGVYLVSMADVEDAAPAFSLCTLVLAGLNFTTSDTTWTIKKTTGSTKTTRTLTLQSGADAVVGVS